MIILLFFIIKIQTLLISKSKNFLIQNDTYALMNVSIARLNTQFIPSMISLTYSIQNQIPGINSYFDLFYYLDSNDLNCYQNVIGNQSYLRPCSFVQNNYTILKTTSISRNWIAGQSIQKINGIDFSVIVDNTRYPYPYGGYSYENISLIQRVEFSITLNNLYENIGIKLIYINCTLYLIYGVINGILIYKYKKNNKRHTQNDQVQLVKKQVTDSDEQYYQQPHQYNILNRTIKSESKYQVLSQRN